MSDWRGMESAPKDGTECLFYSPGRKTASNENARDPYYRVDFFSQRWPRARHQLPEAPYTRWQPLPTPPSKEPL